MAKRPRSVRRLIKRLAKSHDAEVQATVDRNQRLRPSETSKGYHSIDWATHPKTLIGAREVGSRSVAAELSNPDREKRGPFNGRTGDNQSNPGGFTSDMLKRGVRYDPKPVEPKPIRPLPAPLTARFGTREEQAFNRIVLADGAETKQVENKQLGGTFYARVPPVVALTKAYTPGGCQKIKVRHGKGKFKTL